MEGQSHENDNVGAPQSENQATQGENIPFGVDTGLPPDRTFGQIPPISPSPEIRLTEPTNEELNDQVQLQKEFFDNSLKELDKLPPSVKEQQLTALNTLISGTLIEHLITTQGKEPDPKILDLGIHVLRRINEEVSKNTVIQNPTLEKFLSALKTNTNPNTSKNVSDLLPERTRFDTTEIIQENRSSDDPVSPTDQNR